MIDQHLDGNMIHNPFLDMEPWLRQILEEIKRDIKSDHLARDKAFYKAHFGNKSLNKLTLDEMFAPYQRELTAGNQELIEWVVNRWVFRHTDIYRHFAERLGEINANFAEITSLTPEQEERVLAGSVEAFGAEAVYLFAKLNGVVLSESRFETLRKQALASREERAQEEAVQAARESTEDLIRRHAAEIARLTDKYEGKLEGLMRKYSADTEALKRQIRALQNQLHATAVR